MGKATAFDGGGDALVGRADQRDEEEDHACRQKRAANGGQHVGAQDSVSARPYFSIREESCARVSPSSFAARVLLWRARARALMTSGRPIASRVTPPARQR